MGGEPFVGSELKSRDQIMKERKEAKKKGGRGAAVAAAAATAAVAVAGEVDAGAGEVAGGAEAGAENFYRFRFRLFQCVPGVGYSRQSGSPAVSRLPFLHSLAPLV